MPHHIPQRYCFCQVKLVWQSQREPVNMQGTFMQIERHQSVLPAELLIQKTKIKISKRMLSIVVCFKAVCGASLRQLLSWASAITQSPFSSSCISSAFISNLTTSKKWQFLAQFHYWWHTHTATNQKCFQFEQKSKVQLSSQGSDKDGVA